ncbi:ECM21 [Candida metapsilosis]|uniref:ECM21 n=1 Tax=Candida metapsilosis TaxID=273372 RepID=A0A8H7ZL17_9ASCO|nr:ECM21 [Candida metapsilosis]
MTQNVSHSRGFSFDKLKTKVTHRRHSNDSSLMDLVHSHTSSGRRHSSDISPSSINHKVEFFKSLSPPKEPSRLRATSFSLINNSDYDNDDFPRSEDGGSRARSRSRSRSHSVTHGPTLSPSSLFRPKTKDLVKQETSYVISKKLVTMLQDLGLQNPIPLKTSTQGSVSKTIKVYVSNSNDCIYLPPAFSASFTYEDVENGGAILTDDIEGPPQDDAIDSETQSTPSQNNNSTTTTTGSLSQNSSSTHLEDPVANTLYQRMRSLNSPNYLCTKIDSELPIPHTFAVIIELGKDLSTVKDLTFKFQSVTQIMWPMGDPYRDPYNRATAREKFKIGMMQWKTTLNDADYYISSSNSNEVKSKNIGPEDLAKRTRCYELVDTRKKNTNDQGDDGEELDSSSTSINTFSGPSQSHAAPHTEHKAGLYVFLLPILLPEHMPASIVSINGSLIHTLSVSFNKTSDKLNRKLKVSAAYNVPMVRTPPNFANSIADKPIYVNRVWNDAVHYMITFPRKYVSLGSEHVINVKLVPLVKNVVVKRIKFNVLERITYVSKNLQREFDYDSEDPYNLHPKSKENKVRERVIGLCELKTKSKNSSSTAGDPFKEEVVKCPENNLLFSCYEPEKDLNSPRPKNHGKDGDKDKTMIASPLDINVALPFLTTKSDKTLLTSSGSTTAATNSTSRVGEGSIFDGAPSTPKKTASSSRPRQASVDASSNPTSPIIGALETNLANVDEIGLHPNNRKVRSPTKGGKPDVSKSNLRSPSISNYLSDDLSSKHMPPENIKNGYTLTTRALYPDSNYRHIQISHRLQVCFRISKPDPKDDFKMHHYEVVVDTPLILLSSKCNEGSIQLPQYDELDTTTSTTNLGVDQPSKSTSRNGASYTNNGVSIHQWTQNEDGGNAINTFGDQLPSFEEATSMPNSPKSRSISISEDPLSRIPSIPTILPNEPAPAYEYQEQSSQTEVSQTPSLDSINIDEIVSEDLSNTNTNSTTSSGAIPPTAMYASVQGKRPSIKDSLSMSFARNPSVTKDRSSSIPNLTPSGNGTVSSASSSLDGASVGSDGSSASSAGSLMGGAAVESTKVRGDASGVGTNAAEEPNDDEDSQSGNNPRLTPPSSTVPDSNSFSSNAIEESETGEENEKNNNDDDDDDDGGSADDNSSAISPTKVVLSDQGVVDSSDASSVTPCDSHTQFNEAIYNNENEEDDDEEDNLDDDDDDDEEDDSDLDNGVGSDPEDDDLSSLELHERTFDQRLPLLRHISTDTLRTQSSTTKLQHPSVLHLNRATSSSSIMRYGGIGAASSSGTGSGGSGFGNVAASALPTPQATNVTIHSYFSAMDSPSSSMINPSAGKKLDNAQ